jgi:anti-sigma factor RsiW
MACDRSQTVVHAYLDGELDAVGAAEFERHLEHCRECVDALETHEALTAALKRAELYQKGSPALRQKIQASLRPQAENVVSFTPSRVPYRWLAAAAVLLLLAYAGWRILPSLRGADDQTVIAAEMVDAHLRSLQPGHLTDVLSTDQHTVKPWFNGKLDFSPPVQDFSTDGFPLVGGRLDVVHGRAVTALVYGRRKHLISVFIWPLPVNEKDKSLHSGAQQGYHWLAWASNGMELCAVSDVSPSDLDQLHNLFTK